MIKSGGKLEVLSKNDQLGNEQWGGETLPRAPPRTIPESKIVYFEKVHFIFFSFCVNYNEKDSK